MRKAIHKPQTAKQPKPTGISIGMSGLRHAGDNWQAKEDMHVLKQAEQIKSSPERHKAAVIHAKAEVSHLQKVARKKIA